MATSSRGSATPAIACSEHGRHKGPPNHWRPFMSHVLRLVSRLSSTKPLPRAISLLASRVNHPLL
jgi:hypothetical protein